MLSLSFNFVSIDSIFNWYLISSLRIVLVVLTIFLYLRAQILFMLRLELQPFSIDLAFNWYFNSSLRIVFVGIS